MSAYLLASPHIIGLLPFRLFAIGLSGGDVWFGPRLLAAFRAPSFLPTMLLESHWLWWIAAIGIAGLAFYLARQRNDRRMVPAGMVIFAVTVLWIIVAEMYDTPGERLRKAHVALADAAARGDVDTLVSYLAPDITISAMNVNVQSSSREQIAGVLKQYGIKDSTITSYRSSLDGGKTGSTATTEIILITRSDLGPLKTGWRLGWDDLPNENWRIAEAQNVPVQQGLPTN